MSSNGWREVMLGDVVRNLNETIADPEAEGIERVVGLEHLEPNDLQVRRWATLSDGLTFTRGFRAGQVLFGRRRAYQRKVAMPDFDGICSGDIYVFEAEADALLPDLLPFVVQSGRFFDHALRTSAGSLSPRTKWKHLSKFEFRLPPIDDQQELSQLLWAIEDYKRALDRELLMLEELRGALTAGLTELACDGLSVADVVTIAKSGGTPSRKNAAFFKGDIPWLKSGELDDGVSDSGEHISKEAVKQSAAWVVPSGAVLVAMYGDGKTRGNVGFTTAKMTTNQAVLALVPNEELVDPRFLYHWMWSRREHLRSRSGGGSQKNLTKAAIVAEPFPSLPLDKQSARGAQLDQLSKAHTLCVAQRERSRRLQARLANSLLSGTDGLV